MWINFRAILAILGYLTLGVGSLMLLCGIVELLTTRAELKVFLILGVLLTFMGFSFVLSNKSHISSKMTLNQGFFLAALGWFWLTGISALPFYLAGLKVSFIDSLFESMSAFTTTGATIFPKLSVLSFGLHLWRALLQWIGGIGIILTGTALISQFNRGGMQLFKLESFETFDNPLDRAMGLVKGIIKIYLTLTILFFFAMWLIADLPPFEALIHTLTGISTAGFSTQDSSFGSFHNIRADIILIVMMTLGGCPFILMYYAVFLKQPRSLLFDEQFRTYIFLLFFISLIMCGWLFFHNNLSLKDSLVDGTFTVVSIVTGTGSTITDYTTWGPFPIMLLFLCTFLGGCGGSSSCGIKIYKLIIAFKIAKMTMRKSFQKDHLIIPYYNNTPIDTEFAYNIFTYLFLIIISMLGVALLLSLFGLDFITALAGSVSCMMNVGTSFGHIIGPNGNFSSLPDGAKLVLFFAMFVGRIEIFGAYVLFYKSFWQK